MPIFVVNGQDWHYCLAGSSITAPRIFIFSISMGANYSFEVKNIEIWVPAFFKHNNSSVATVISWFKINPHRMHISKFILHAHHTRVSVRACVRV
jgi:hypothetical protein